MPRRKNQAAKAPSLTDQYRRPVDPTPQVYGIDVVQPRMASVTGSLATNQGEALRDILSAAGRLGSAMGANAQQDKAQRAREAASLEKQQMGSMRIAAAEDKVHYKAEIEQSPFAPGPDGQLSLGAEFLDFTADNGDASNSAKQMTYMMAQQATGATMIVDPKTREPRLVANENVTQPVINAYLAGMSPDVQQSFMKYHSRAQDYQRDEYDRGIVAEIALGDDPINFKGDWKEAGEQPYFQDVDGKAWKRKTAKAAFETSMVEGRYDRATLILGSAGEGKTPLLDGSLVSAMTGRLIEHRRDGVMADLATSLKTRGSGGLKLGEELTERLHLASTDPRDEGFGGALDVVLTNWMGSGTMVERPSVQRDTLLRLEQAMSGDNAVFGASSRGLRSIRMAQARIISEEELLAKEEARRSRRVNDAQGLSINLLTDGEATVGEGTAMITIRSHEELQEHFKDTYRGDSAWMIKQHMELRNNADLTGPPSDVSLRTFSMYQVRLRDAESGAARQVILDDARNALLGKATSTTDSDVPGGEQFTPQLTLAQHKELSKTSETESLNDTVRRDRDWLDLENRVNATFWRSSGAAVEKSNMGGRSYVTVDKHTKPGASKAEYQIMTSLRGQWRRWYTAPEIRRLQREEPDVFEQKKEEALSLLADSYLERAEVEGWNHVKTLVGEDRKTRVDSWNTTGRKEWKPPTILTSGTKKPEEQD